MAEEKVQDSAAGRVLIAEDDKDFRQLLVKRARRMGLSVVEAADGDEAMAELESGEFDALVLDVYLSGPTGIDVLRAARKRDPELQALLLSGNATLEAAIDALRAGAYDFLTKPLDSLSAFERSLSRALEHRQLLRDNQRLFTEVERLAETDALTGLFNRRKLEEALDAEIERAWRYGRPLSIIMIDVDDLKHINDTHGHQAGDAVLIEVAEMIRSQVRVVDIPTRYGGDEFMIILPEADLNEAALVATRIASHSQDLAVEGTRASFSTGVVEWGPQYATAGDFLSVVDRTLYEAKGAGKGQISVEDPVGAPPSEQVGERRRDRR